jgi:hypothetical protein
VRDVTPSEGGFHDLTPSLRQVICPEKFKAGHIDKYDRSSNPEEFIHVYHTVIEAAGGDNRVKVIYLHTTLSSAARSWLINSPRDLSTPGTSYVIFIGNF